MAVHKSGGRGCPSSLGGSPSVSVLLLGNVACTGRFCPEISSSNFTMLRDHM